MGLKKYIFFSIVFIAVIGGYVFLSVQGDYTVNIEMLQLNVTLPIALWVILPALILVVATVLHILFYGFRNYLQTRAVEKDEENLIEVIKDNLLQNNSSKNFKIKEIKEIAAILSQMELVAKTENFESDNKEINKIVKAIKEINDGKYVYDKSIRFNKSGSLSEKNLLNRLKEDVDFCLDVIKKADSYSSQAVKEAFLKVVEDKSMTTIKKVLEGLKLDKEMLWALIHKDSQNSEFALDTQTLIKYIKEVDFTKEDYVKLVAAYKKSISPDELIKMFESLSNDVETATDAYFYVLMEFEMLDRVRELLNAYGAHEYTAYRALIDLKDNGRNYTIDSLSYK